MRARAGREEAKTRTNPADHAGTRAAPVVARLGALLSSCAKGIVTADLLQCHGTDPRELNLDEREQVDHVKPRR
jgi:hypothetical protein